MNIVFLLRPKNTVAYLYDTNTLRQGLEKMRAHGYTAIPVIRKDGEYAGTVSEGDFLWHMLDHGDTDIKSQEEYSVNDLMRPSWNPAVKITATMDELLQKVTEQNFVPVVDDRNMFIGIITRKDVLRMFQDNPERFSFLQKAVSKE